MTARALADVMEAIGDAKAPAVRCSRGILFTGQLRAGECALPRVSLVRRAPCERGRRDRRYHATHTRHRLNSGMRALTPRIARTHARYRASVRNSPPRLRRNSRAQNEAQRDTRRACQRRARGPLLPPQSERTQYLGRAMRGTRFELALSATRLRRRPSPPSRQRRRESIRNRCHPELYRRQVGNGAWALESASGAKLRR